MTDYVVFDEREESGMHWNRVLIEYHYVIHEMVSSVFFHFLDLDLQKISAAI